MLRLKHLARTGAGIVDYAFTTRSWWVLFLVAGLFVVVVAATTTQVVVPTVVYTLF